MERWGDRASDYENVEIRVVSVSRPDATLEAVGSHKSQSTEFQKHLSLWFGDNRQVKSKTDGLFEDASAITLIVPIRRG